MRVAIVSTYPPRACGIGTFTHDLRSALLQGATSPDVDVVALVREPAASAEPGVRWVIRQDVRADYVATPALLEEWGTDVVLIEHEYGIFGGDAGSFVLSLTRELRVPFVVTLHTVLSEPSPAQAAALREMCRRAALVTVFTDTARRMVVAAGLAPTGKVRVVPHGAPTLLRPPDPGHRTSRDPRAGDHASTGLLAQLAGRTVLSTFGLISAGKGIETAIAALTGIVPRHPEVLYLVAGQTHPEVASQDGERYRLSLERLVRDRGLASHVRFVDRFLPIEELAGLLSRTDLYLTPYRSRDQIVSGALTFAVAAGCPVVSTPYFYAEDLLASGAGVLAPFDDPSAFAAAVLGLLDDPDLLDAAAREAGRVGAGLAWPAVAGQTVEVLDHAVRRHVPGRAGHAGRVAAAPSIRPDHLLTLVDDVGIIQHADGVVPVRSSGYCVDDMARLVIVALGLDRDRRDGTFTRMVTLGLSFLSYAWDPVTGAMHNLMSYDRHWLDQAHLGDHLGRAVWALGEVIAAHPPRAVAAPSLRLLEQIAPAAAALDSPRAMALAALGLTRPAPRLLPDEVLERLGDLGTRLLHRYSANRAEDWCWSENELTYDNARLPHALIAAGHRLKDSEMRTAGLKALDWYAGQCGLNGDVIRLVGNKWRHRAVAQTDPPSPEGDEQPLDAAALVEAFTDAFIATGQREYGRRAIRAFEWFLGRNQLGEPVYDFTTGGCHDGLGPDGLNENQGAESTLAFFQALLALQTGGLQVPPRQL